MGYVPPRFGINVAITKCRIGEDELVVVVLFLMDGSGGGRRGAFVLIGVLSGFINYDWDKQKGTLFKKPN
jgi:hypothetical protein